MVKRQEIQNEYKWDLSSYYKTEEEWENEYNNVVSQIESIVNFQNKLKTEQEIYNCLILDHNLSVKIESLYVFAHLKVCEDFGVGKNIQMLEKIKTLNNKYGVLASFIVPELSELSNEILLNLKHNTKFGNFSIILDEIIRNKPHILSKKEEELLSSATSFSGGFSSVFDAFDTDVKFDDVTNCKGDKLPLTHALYSEYLQGDDGVLRRSAFINMHKKFGQFNSTLAMNYINKIKASLFYAKARKFDSSLNASIFDEHSSKDVYTSLINAVNSKLPLFHKYYKVKAKALKLNKIDICDRLAPISKQIQRKYTYNEAIDLIVKALKPLGEDYQNLIIQAKNDRWIDVFESDGKQSGAFSSGAYGKNPVVLTNFTGNLNSVFTLAHELGHAMHTYFSNKNQCFEKAGYTIFVAEIASTVNEMLLLLYLLNNCTDKDEQIYLLDYFCAMMCSTVHRQTMFAEFEEFAHKKYQETGALSQDILNNKYFELNKTYFGENVEVMHEVKFEWSRIPHFYSPFYVYKYATGLITAIVISENLINGTNNQKEKYFEFLKTGGALTPVETVKLAGIDLENPISMKKAFGFFEKMIEKLENLLK